MTGHTVTVEVPARGFAIDDVVKALNNAGFTVGTPELKGVSPPAGRS